MSYSNIESSIIKFLKESFKPKKSYAIFFSNLQFLKLFTLTLQQLFKNASSKVFQFHVQLHYICLD